MGLLYEDFLFDTELEESVIDNERKYLVLIIYDIVENKSRVKFAKYLQTFGHRVQKSAFEAKVNYSAINYRASSDDH